MRSTKVLAFFCLALLPAVAGPRAPRAEEKVEAPAPEALHKIRKLIRNTLSEDQEDRDKAWKELKDMGNLAVPGLLALLRQPGALSADSATTPEMLCSILILLGDSKDPRGGPALVELLENPSAPVRRDAARAVGESNYKAGLPALQKHFADAKEDEEVRLHAALAAAKLGAREGLAALTGLARSPSAATRTRAVFGLGKFGGPEQLPVVRAALDDPQVTVRLDAVEALRLVALSADSGTKPRSADSGTKALSADSGTRHQAQAALTRALADADHRVRGAAIEALRSLTGRNPGPALAAALDSPDLRVRLAAVAALEETEYKEALPALKRCFSNAQEDERVRLVAARAAARWGAEALDREGQVGKLALQALDALKALARAGTTPTRARAFAALGRFGSAESALEAVAAGLADPEASVRAAAVDGLARLGKPACGNLIAALKDTDEAVRDAALESLRVISGEDLGSDPRAWQEWLAKPKEGPQEE